MRKAVGRSFFVAVVVSVVAGSAAFAGQEPDTVRLEFDSSASGDPNLRPVKEDVKWLAITPNGRETAIHWVELKDLATDDVIHANAEAMITTCRKGPDFSTDPNEDGHCVGSKYYEFDGTDVETKLILTEGFNERKDRPSLSGTNLTSYEKACSHNGEAHCVHTHRENYSVPSDGTQWLVMIARAKHPAAARCKTNKERRCTVATLDGKGALNAVVERGAAESRQVSRSNTAPPAALPVSSQDSEDESKRRVVYSADLGNPDDLVGDLVDVRALLALRHSLGLRTSPAVNSFLLLAKRPGVKDKDKGVRISAPNGQNCEPDEDCDHPNLGSCIFSNQDAAKNYRYVNLVAGASRGAASESDAVGVRGNDGDLKVTIYDAPAVQGGASKKDACKG